MDTRLVPDTKPTRDTWRGHARPDTVCWFGTGATAEGIGRPVTLNPAGRRINVSDATTGEPITVIGASTRMWLSPAVPVTAEQVEACRLDALHAEAEIGNYLHKATSGRTHEPDIKLAYSHLAHQQLLAAQAGRGLLAAAIAERLSELHPAYLDARAEVERQLAAQRAKIIAERAAQASPDEVVIVACGGRKQDRPAPAGELYTGSYHAACRKAAAARGGRVVILSARHGLLPLDRVVDPYEQRMGRPGCITARQVRDQAVALGIAGARRVTVLAGWAYAELARAVWPCVEWPLDGTRGIGEQLARLALIAATPRPARSREPKCVVRARRAALRGQLALFDLPV